MAQKVKTFAGVCRLVKKLEPNFKVEDEGFKTAAILISALIVGANVRKIASFTGYSRRAVAERGRRLRKNKVWVGTKTRADWFDKDSGGVSFWADNLVADGLLGRSA